MAQLAQPAPSARRRKPFGVDALYHRALAFGIWVLFAPWAVRTLDPYFGFLGSIKVTYLNLIAAGALTVTALWSIGRNRQHGIRMRAGMRAWLGGLIGWALVMLVGGLLRGNPALSTLQESMATAIFFSGVAIGVSRAEWQTIDRAFINGLLWVGVPVVLLGLLQAGTLGSSALRTSLVYSASAILVPSTFFVLALPRLQVPFSRVAAVAAFLVYGASQVMFAKRGPVFRWGVAFYLGFIHLPPYLGKRRAKTWLAAVAVVGIGIGAVTMTEAGRGAFGGLAARMGLLESIPAYFVAQDPSGGPSRRAVERETFRLQEVAIFVENMSGPEHVIGLGFGGYVVDRRFRDWQVRTLSGEGMPGAKGSLHIGFFWSYVKGGVLFFLAFHLGILAIILSWVRYRGDALAINCWAFVLINELFSTMEGLWMQPGVELTTFLVGAAVGFCVSGEAGVQPAARRA